MPSWEEEQTCPCYQFMLIDGKGVFTQKIDHSYEVTVRLKGSEELTHFKKTINSDSVVSHQLENWAAVTGGSVDDLLAGLPPTSSRIDFMPWLNMYGFTGNFENLFATLLNNGDVLTTSESKNTWSGNIHESLDATYGEVDFANIGLDAAHIKKEITTLSASATSNVPMGYREIASGADGGWAVRWLDYVAFVDYAVNKEVHSEDVIKVKTATFTITDPTTTSTVTYNISDSTVPYGSDVRFWEPVYPLLDESSDGWQLGFSHWILENAVASRWAWFREVVDIVMRGGDQIDTAAFTQSVPTNGNWRGSIAVSRQVDDSRYVLASSERGSRLFKITIDGIAEEPLPEGMEAVNFPICPL